MIWADAVAQTIISFVVDIRSSALKNIKNDNCRIDREVGDTGRDKDIRTESKCWVGESEFWSHSIVEPERAQTCHHTVLIIWGDRGNTDAWGATGNKGILFGEPINGIS